MSMRRYTFEEVSRGDDEIYQLALYDATRGKILIPQSRKELLDLQRKVAEKFNYFKDLIQRGEATVGFIQQRVLSAYGPFPREDEGDFSYDSLTKYIEEERALTEYEENFKKTETILDVLLDSLNKTKREMPPEGFDFPPPIENDKRIDLDEQEDEQEDDIQE